MIKRKRGAQLLLGPLPPALIACGYGKEMNIITLAWVGVVNSSPPMISAAIRPNRHSHEIIRNSGEFTVNLPAIDQVDIVDGCGTLSGRAINKFEHFKLTAVNGILQNAPMIDECPVNMELKVEHTLELGSHTLFIGEVIASYVAEDWIDAEGKINREQDFLLGFCAGSYLKTDPLNLSIGYTRKDSS